MKHCDPWFSDAEVVAFAYRMDAQSTDSFVVLIKKKRECDDNQLERILVKAKMAIMQSFQLIPHDIQLITQSFLKTTSGKVQRNLCVKLYDALEFGIEMSMAF